MDLMSIAGALVVVLAGMIILALGIRGTIGFVGLGTSMIGFGVCVLVYLLFRRRGNH